MTTKRGETQAKVLAVSERDLLVGQSWRAKPAKATDNTALPDGSIYLERNQETNTVMEYIRVDGEWVFSKRYTVDRPIESLLAEQVRLLRQTVLGLSILSHTDLEELAEHATD